MKQKSIYGVIALTMVMVLGIGAVSAYGFGNSFMNSDMSEEDRAVMQTKQEEMREAVTSGDYESWKALHEERIGQMKVQLTMENFNTIRERHQEMEEFRNAVDELKISGDFSLETMQELREQYGIDEMSNFGRGKAMYNQRAGNQFGREIASEMNGNCHFADIE